MAQSQENVQSLMTHQTLIFATNNQHKVEEFRAITGNRFDVLTLQEAGIDIDIPEPHATLEANALEKSSTIHQLTGGKNVFSEDTGLEVDALNGEPGVKSARYAGDGRDFQANIDKLMQKMHGIPSRTARFRTVISLIWNNRSYSFEGICEGRIALEQSGEKGFGYDPVFIPNGSQINFAEMGMEQKNQYSHRRKAVDKLLAFLNQLPA